MSLSSLAEEEEEGDDEEDDDGDDGLLTILTRPARLDDGDGDDAAHAAAAAAAAPCSRNDALPADFSCLNPSESSALSASNERLLLVRGVLGAKTIRSTYACLHVARLRSSAPAGGGGMGEEESYSFLGSTGEESDDDYDYDDEGGTNAECGTGEVDVTGRRPAATYCMVRLQFTGDDDNVRALKSLCRRSLKHRDLIRVVAGATHDSDGTSARGGVPSCYAGSMAGTTYSQAPHNPIPPSPTHRGRTLVIHIGSVQEAIETIQVEAVRYWDVLTFQKWQQLNLQWMRLPSNPSGSMPRRNPSRRANGATVDKGHQRQIQSCHEEGIPGYDVPLPGSGGCLKGCSGQFHSSSNLDRQVQAEYVANFLFHMMLHKVHEEEEDRRRRCTVASNDDDPDALCEASASAASSSTSNPHETSSRQSLPGILLPPDQWATTPPLALLERLSQHPMLHHDVVFPATSVPPDRSDELDRIAAQHRCESALELFRRAFQVLNAGTGVVDVAGGSGYLSLALGSCGVKATVVDPRENVGTLPRRHRKAWRKLVERHNRRNGDGAEPISIPGAASAGCVLPSPVQFQFLRAWFGTPPQGVDEGFRHPDLETMDGTADRGARGSSSPALPVVDDSHTLLTSCSALVALHPDEATDAVVDAAVAAQTPFCVVPCCVFSRLFPHRRVVGGGGGAHDSRPVCTRADLVDYLCEKDPTIRRATLPFVGSNTILWSTF